MHHLIAPEIRALFDDDALHPSDDVAYAEALEHTRLPSAPLLFFALGCFYGEWLTMHSFTHWATEAPVQPLQDCVDATETDKVVVFYPFTHVAKALRHPSGDALWYKAAHREASVRVLLPSTYVELRDDDVFWERATDRSGREQSWGALASSGTLSRDLALGAALRASDLELAERLASELVEIDRRPCRLLLRADVRRTREGARSDAALEDLDEALEIEPRFAEARPRRANSLANRDELEEAIEDLEQILDECDDPGICGRAEDLLAEIEGNEESSTPDGQ